MPKLSKYKIKAWKALFGIFKEKFVKYCENLELVPQDILDGAAIQKVELKRHFQGNFGEFHGKNRELLLQDMPDRAASTWNRGRCTHIDGEKGVKKTFLGIFREISGNFERKIEK